MAVIALDLGGTKLAGALVSSRGSMLHKTMALLEDRGGSSVGKLIRQVARGLATLARKEHWKLQGVAVSVPGISDPAGRVWAPNISGWEDYPLRRELAAALGRRVPVRVENDRACCIVGEAWRGAARGIRNAIYLSVGTGIGAGIMVNGEVLQGSGGTAGSIGWLALNRPFRPEYSHCGCFEYYASGDGLARSAREQGLELAGPALFEAYHRGEPAALAAIDQAIQFWGMAVANLVSLFDPEKIIFGGGVFGPAHVFLKQIEAEARKWAQPVAMRKVKLEPSKLGADAALYGAASLALRRAPATR